MKFSVKCRIGHEKKARIETKKWSLDETSSQHLNSILSNQQDEMLNWLYWQIGVVFIRLGIYITIFWNFWNLFETSTIFLKRHFSTIISYINLKWTGLLRSCFLNLCFNSAYFSCILINDYNQWWSLLLFDIFPDRDSPLLLLLLLYLKTTLHTKEVLHFLFSNFLTS